MMRNPIFTLILFLQLWSGCTSMLAPTELWVSPGTHSQQLVLPGKLNSSSTLEINVELDDTTSSVYFPYIQLMLLYGQQTQSYHLDNTTRSVSALLCLEQRPTFSEMTLVLNRQENDDGPHKIKVLVRLIRRDLQLHFGAPEKVEVTLGRPQTFMIDPVSGFNSARKDRYEIKVENMDEETKDVCMIVAAYGNSCPLKDQEDTIRQAEVWLTALEKGVMTLRYEHHRFNEPFYLSIIVLESDSACRLPDEDLTYTKKPRRKIVQVSVDRALRYTSYVAPVSAALAGSILLVLISSLIMLTKRFGNSDPQSGKPTAVPTSSPSPPPEIQETDDIGEKNSPIERIDSPNRSNGDQSFHSFMTDRGDELDAGAAAGQIDQDIRELQERCRQALPDDSTRQGRVNKGLRRLNRDPKLNDMTAILEDDVYFRRNRSRVYCYLVPLLSLFYFIPSIQFVFLVKRSENMTGSQDLCFHNFECAKHFYIFTDFNHVVSNVSYVIFGIGFTLLVLLKAKKLPKDQNPKQDHKSGRGILQQLSIFYAMGFALASQGFFSVCYHVCPTNHSLQFDSTMMYVMCMLGIVKIYQFRHPDANANAYSFFYFLGMIVLLEALALYSTSWLVYGFFILLYIAMTVFIAIDCYYIGVGRLDSRIAKILAKEVLTGWIKSEGKPRIKYRQRFAFALVFCCLNLVHAVYIFIAKVYNPRKTVTHVVLLILAGNLFVYIAYYVFRKNKMRYETLCKRKMASAQEMNTVAQADEDIKQDEVDSKYYIPVGERQLPVFLSAGSFFAIAALIFGVTAAYFYINRSANRNLSPAESRNLNEACTYASFYDNHDMWHFFSSSAIFMAFLALLTVDDDFLLESREDIEVF